MWLTSFTLLAMASLVNTFTIPNSLKDHFTMTLESDNTILLTAIESFPNTTTTPSRSQQDPPLPIDWHLCTGQAIDYFDWEAARDSLGAFCDDGNMIPDHGKIVVNVNGVLAYACSAGGLNPCSRAEIVWFGHWLDDECGLGLAGMADMSSWAKRYGRGWNGDVVCRGVRGG
ncbi:hypothetical protein QBC34DRAFT_455835 [Podospora aff. communis PSN243]|uniref:Ecp2 effector protein domain-containing protein n=1 Tax=Podospora aff. communis PSN243 TaxID=3040156 RepID=A0AAV9FZG5_9PEZI|nr:hypothetical protein QBC34DRAFT_455835 [Podospora aff. communis PSN243]